MKSEATPATEVDEIASADDPVAFRRPSLTHDVHGELKPRLRGLVHLYSAIPIGLAGLLLIILTPTVNARFAAAIYAIAVTGMLVASACYHRLRVTEHTRRLLRRLDHSMIGVCIAGTYTPVIVLTLDGSLRIALLAIMWAGAGFAMLVSFVWPKVPSWLRALVYVALGFAGVAVMPFVYSEGSRTAFWMIIVGAAFYIIGALAYATRSPNFWPRVFGFHEVFHTLVVMAAISHFIAVAFVIADAA